MRADPARYPQSVSVVTRQRMQDQDLQTIDQVLTNATGVSSQQVDSERSSYFSRGFEITNFALTMRSPHQWATRGILAMRRKILPFMIV